jgi:Ca2+-binding RTX toxin-like protein
MTGGPGGDTYVRDEAGDQVIEQPSEGFDTERSSISWVIDTNVERLVLLGTAADATGDGRANALVGNSANNVLDGGRGGDSMAGGPGDDTYKVDSGADQVTEAQAQGTDIILSQVPQVLSANVENLTFGQPVGNVEAIGNASANTLVGNSEANLLDGGAGNDTLKGQGGDDTLLGGDGNDTLAGGLGRDVLSAGAGKDHFVFDTPIASGVNVDQIVDFVKGQDVIDLSAAIFAGVGAPGTVLSAGSFVSEAGAVAHTADQHIVHDTGTGLLYYDTDGSGAQHMVPFAQVAAGQALAAGDFHTVA